MLSNGDSGISISVVAVTIFEKNLSLLFIIKLDLNFFTFTSIALAFSCNASLVSPSAVSSCCLIGVTSFCMSVIKFRYS